MPNQFAKNVAFLAANGFSSSLSSSNRMNRIGCAHRKARATVDAAVRIDIKLSGGFEFRFILLGMDAVGRAHIDAKQVFDAGVGDDISHDEIPRMK